MGDDRPPTRIASRYGFAAAVALGWAAAVLVHWQWIDVLHSFVQNAIVRILSGFPGEQMFALQAHDLLQDGLLATYGLTLFLTTLALPLGVVARMFARSRVRAGQDDAMDRAARWTVAHPRATSGLVALVPVACQTLILWANVQGYARHSWSGVATLAGVAAFAGILQARVVRAGLRTLLAPTGALTSAAPPRIEADEIRFDAVAVTREARAAVAAFAAITAITAAWLCSERIQALFMSRHVFWGIGAYVALASLVPLVFKRASKIAVGLDGIYVSGTSRARFIAFRDLDEVRERGGDLELRRAGRTVLRLQLHGGDIARRAAIAARIEESIARVEAVQRDGATHFVASVSSGAVARSARGGTDYRMPSVSRDALWSLVEGAGVDDRARTAAARALVETGDPRERERLRVAAERCADPKVRVALEELAVDEAAPGSVRGASPSREGGGALRATFVHDPADRG